MLLFSIFLCSLLVASNGDSVEDHLQLEMNQVRGLLERVNQLEHEVSRLDQTQQEMQEKHEAEIFELKQQASMTGTDCTILNQVFPIVKGKTGYRTRFLFHCVAPSS